MRRFTEESVWRKSVDQEDIVEKQLQNKGRSECGTDIKDELHEECGVFGVWAPGRDVARITYFGLRALQHRGQDSAGIAVGDGKTVLVRKDLGLVTQVFTDADLSAMPGKVACGHCRYGTAGAKGGGGAPPATFFMTCSSARHWRCWMRKRKC